MVLVRGGPARIRQQEVEGRVIWPIFGKEEDSYWATKLEKTRERARDKRQKAADSRK